MSGDSSSSTFHSFKNSSCLVTKISGIENFENSKNRQLRSPEFRNFSNPKINTLESLLMYYFRFIHITFGSFMALSLHSWHSVRLSAHGSWPARALWQEGAPRSPSRVRAWRSFLASRGLRRSWDIGERKEKHFEDQACLAQNTENHTKNGVNNYG